MLRASMERKTITVKKPAVSKLGIFLKSEQDGKSSTVVTASGDVLGPAGLRVGDIIVTIQGETIDGAVHGCTILSKTTAGTDLVLVVDRVVAAGTAAAVLPVAMAAPLAQPVAPVPSSSETESDVLSPLPNYDGKAPAPAPADDNVFAAVGNWVGMISNRLQGNA